MPKPITNIKNVNEELVIHPLAAPLPLKWDAIFVGSFWWSKSVTAIRIAAQMIKEIVERIFIYSRTPSSAAPIRRTTQMACEWKGKAVVIDNVWRLGVSCSALFGLYQSTQVLRSASRTRCSEVNLINAPPPLPKSIILQPGRCASYWNWPFDDLESGCPNRSITCFWVKPLLIRSWVT